jgi:catechol 2,3-dioxygenase-like lactoylglutathione lyase family enzyme
MSQPILRSAKIVAFAHTSMPARALEFYRDTLGLRLVEESPFAFVFDANGTTLRLTPVKKVAIGEYTVLGWDVDDIEGAIAGLEKAGVQFNRYPGLDQDKFGIWTSPGGQARVAWFKDPDGNTLSVTEHRKQA